MAVPIVAGEHPIAKALFIVAAILFFGIAIAKPEYFGPLRPLIERLLNH